MNFSHTIRRSAYASRLSAFADFVFDDVAAFAHRGGWRAFFSRRIGADFNGRLIFDVGCADAGYLARIATKHPTTAFIGLDWKYKAVHDGAARVAANGVKNVALLRARAQDIRQIFTDGEVDEIWIFHPEPCDRAAELNNRLISEPFLIDVHHVLRDAASHLCLKTDHPGYCQWVLALFDLPEPAWFDADARSRFARAGTPKLRVNDLMPPEQKPAASAMLQTRFRIELNAPDFWQDARAQEHVAQHAFAGETTAYEARFLKKRQPIHYMEWVKRLRDS